MRHNLLHLLELPASCAPSGAPARSPVTRSGARRAGCGDYPPHAAPAFLSLQDALGRLLDSPTEEAWRAEWLPWAGGMMDEWEGAGLPSEALLHLCQWLPQTLRGQRLQRRAAHAAMERMMARRQADWVAAKEAEAEKQKAEAMEVEAEEGEAEAEAEAKEEAEEAKSEADGAEEVEEAAADKAAADKAAADKAAGGKAVAAGGTGGDQAGAVVEEEAEDGTRGARAAGGEARGACVEGSRERAAQPAAAARPRTRATPPHTAARLGSLT